MAVTSLSAGVRAALTSLTSTAAASQQGQLRLATGKKVNSAIDSPVNFFTAAGLNDRASQFSDLVDGISNGIQTITAASKGIDGITKLVQSLQSTVKQAQNDAAANRPKIAADIALGTAAEAIATNSTIRDVALNKKLVGTDPVASTAGAPGSLGMDAATATDFQLTAGETTFSFKITADTTVRDVVENINRSGIATASVGSDGKLSVIGTGSDALSAEVGVITAGTPPDPDTFAASATDAALLFGTTDVEEQSQPGSSAVRSSLVSQFNDIRDQIDALAKDSGFNGINLLAGDRLSVTFNEKTGTAKNKLDVQGDTISSTALGVGKANDSQTSVEGEFSFQNDNDLSKAADALTNTLSSLRATSSTLGSKLQIVQTRQDFTKDMINTLTQGADNLTLADTNEEGAKLLALQTRQQLSQTALTLSNQADQAVLRLF